MGGALCYPVVSGCYALWGIPYRPQQRLVYSTQGRRLCQKKRASANKRYLFGLMLELLPQSAVLLVRFCDRLLQNSMQATLFAGLLTFLNAFSGLIV